MGRGRPRTKNITRGRLSSKSTVDRKPIRPLERQRMRPWLIQLLDSEECKQLVWTSKKENVFRIAWKHAAGQTFDAEADATLFERWARHTGKYYNGDKPDPKRWKANFRCALNSLLDVEENKSQGVRKGNNAFKVYRFLEEKRPKKSGKKAKATDANDDDNDDEFQVLRNLGTKSRPKIPTRMELDSEGSESASSPAASDSGHSDWDDMTSSDLRCSHDQEMERDNCEKSPLPDFEKLCQTANLFGLYGSSCPQEPLMEGHSPRRLPETYSPQRSAETYSPQRSAESYSPQRSDDYTYSPQPSTDLDEVSSNVSSCHKGEVDDLEELILVDGTEFSWNDFLQPDDTCYIQEAPEQIIGGEDRFMMEPGPNVIVLSQNNLHDYIYTSMAEL